MEKSKTVVIECCFKEGSLCGVASVIFVVTVFLQFHGVTDLRRKGEKYIAIATTFTSFFQSKSVLLLVG